MGSIDMIDFKKYLTEENERKIRQILIVYPGRFSPPTTTHAGIFQWMTGFHDPAGCDNLKFVIATSNKVEAPKSPFNFSQKKFMWTTMFGVKPEQIIQTEQPYQPKEITSKYDPASTALVLVVGEKDRERMAGFENGIQWNDKMPIEKSMGEAVYFLVVPHVDGISGTEARAALKNVGSMSQQAKTEAFEKVFGKPVNDDVVKILDGSITESVLHEDHDPIATASYPAGSGGGFLIDPTKRKIYDMKFSSHIQYLENLTGEDLYKKYGSEKGIFLNLVFKKMHMVHCIVASQYNGKKDTPTIYLTGLKQDIDKLIAWRGLEIVKNFDQVIISINARFAPGYVEFDAAKNMHSLTRLKQELGIKMEYVVRNFISNFLQETKEKTQMNENTSADLFMGSTGGWIDPNKKQVYKIPYAQHKAFICSKFGCKLNDYVEILQYGYDKLNLVRVQISTVDAREWLTMTGNYVNLVAAIEVYGKEIAQYDKVMLQVADSCNRITMPKISKDFGKYGWLKLDMDLNHHSVAALKQAVGIQMEG